MDIPGAMEFHTGYMMEYQRGSESYSYRDPDSRANRLWKSLGNRMETAWPADHPEKHWSLARLSSMHSSYRVESQIPYIFNYVPLASSSCPRNTVPFTAPLDS